ncbi:ABC transporter permease [bacterium]|nr:MAG: ABC transporter permease [bacterium]
MTARLIYAFARRDIMARSTSPFSWVVQIASLLFFASMFFFIGRTFDQSAAPSLRGFHGHYFAYALVGLVFARFQTAALQSFATAVRTDQTAGTLEAMLVTRASVPAIVFSAGAWSFAYAGIQVVLYLLLGALVFGVDLHHANVLAAALALLLAVAATSPVGILVAACVVAFRQGNALLSVIAAATSLLSGVFYPVAVLPRVLQVCAVLLPPTHALDALRQAVLLGASVRAIWPDLSILLGFAALGMPLALGAFALAVRQAKRVGSLSYV